MLFSPVYLEKLDSYIDCLDHAAELAYQHAVEIGLDVKDSPDLTPICTKCMKRRRLDFDKSLSGIQDDVFGQNNESKGTSEIDNFSSYQNESALSSANSSRLSVSSSNLTNPYDVTKPIGRTGSLKRDKNKVDSTFMSVMLKTLVTLNSSSESLNAADSRINRGMNENLRSRKKAYLQRRHTTILDENVLMLSANANAAVSSRKTNTQAGIVNSAISDVSEKKEDASAVLRSKVTRKPRPYSYPNQRYLQRQATAPNLQDNKNNLSRVSAKGRRDLQAKKGKAVLSGENMDNAGCSKVISDSHDKSHSSDEKLSKSKPINIKVGATNTEGKAHHMYYSLSPAMLDAPLRVEDLGSSERVAGDINITKESRLSMDDLKTAGEEPITSHDSSLSSNPEYFSVISKRKKRRQKKLGADILDTGFGSHSLPAKISNATDTAIISSNKNSTRKAGDEAQTIDLQSRLVGHPFSHSLDDLSRSRKNISKCRQFKDENLFNETDDTLDEGNTSYLHGDGLLYTSSFGIGDHSWCTNLAESDLVTDGYCKCSFCNHDMIFTPMKSETHVVPPKTDAYEKDFSSIHEELLQLRSFSTSDNSVTSFRTIRHEPKSDLQTDHFPYPRLPKEFMTSHLEDSMASQLDISMDVACGDDENSSVRSSPVQKALQRDIEKHSSGVASVLNLCEVLLHDGDACSNESEKDSIEQATNSLDRRWRNICSLSMERKLKIEETQRLWKKFFEDYSRFGDWLKSAERVVSRPNTFMISYQVAREELKRFESFQRQVHESLTQLELINKQYRRLARENRTDASNKLKHMIHDGNSRWDAISHRVASILRRLKYAIQRREGFETKRESLLVWLTETDLRLTNVEHFMQSENYDKLKEVKNFQATIEEHIPRIIELDARGLFLIEKSEESDCVVVEEELSELHRYCREVIARLDRYHKRLLRIMNEPPPLDSSLFEDTELAQMSWWENYISGTSSSRNSSPSLQSPDHDRFLATPRSQGSDRRSATSHSGRATPESLEWDLYDISQSELETKDAGALTDDGSIPEISPFETASDDIPLLHVSRDSTGTRQSNISRRSHDVSVSHEPDDLSPAKKLRTSQDEMTQQFMNDLIATLAWLDATTKVTNQEMKKSESKFDKTISDLDQQSIELKSLQASIEQRKAIVLSINLVSSSYSGNSDVTIKLSSMNNHWEWLQQKSMDWNKSLQESLSNSQEFQSTLTELSAWVGLQNQHRDDMNKIQQKENADSSPTSRMHRLRKDHKVLDQIRIDTLEAISKVTSMQDICIRLTTPGDKNHPVGGTRALSEKVRSTNGRLKALLDAVRSDLRDIEHKIKATRRRVREERSSESDSEISTDGALRSSTPIRLRMLQRKVEASELHSSGKNPIEDQEMATTQPTDKPTDTPTKGLYDVTQESCSSIDDVTHKSLHARSKLRNQGQLGTKTVIGKAVAMKQTTVAAERRGITVAMSAKRTKTGRMVTTVIPSENTKKAGLCCRVCFAAFPFYLLMLLLFLLPWFLQATSDDGFACLRQNNYAFSFTPMLTYTNGPPPV